MLLGYARISTNNKKQNIDFQISELKEYGVDERHIFKDYVSGSKDTRPGLNELLDYIKPGDTVVVWKLDRLGRSTSNLLKILEKIKRQRVNFVSLTESIDTSTPQGNLFFQLIAVFCEFERNLIRERTRAGIELAKSKGKKIGRPIKITSEMKDMICQAFVSGVPKTEIANLFNISRISVERVVKEKMEQFKL